MTKLPCQSYRYFDQVYDSYSEWRAEDHHRRPKASWTQLSPYLEGSVARRLSVYPCPIDGL